MTEQDLEQFYKLSEKDRAEVERDAVELKRKMLELKENPSFKLFQTRLDKQIGGKTAILLAEPKGLDSAVSMLYTSGMIAGIVFASNFIDTLIDHCEHILLGKEARKEQEEQKGDE